MPGIEVPQQEWEVVPPLVTSVPGPPGPAGEKGEPGEPGESVPLVSGLVFSDGTIIFGTDFTITKGGEGEYVIKVTAGITDPSRATITFSTFKDALVPEVVEAAEGEFTVVFKTSSVGGGKDTAFYFIVTEAKKGAI